MHKSLSFSLAILFLILVSGCGEEKIDASSEEKLKASTEKVLAALPDEKKAQFEEAVAILLMKDVLFTPGDEQTMNKNVKATFHGKTAEEIIADAKKSQAETDAQMKKFLEGGN